MRDIKQEHPEYMANADMWERYSDLYVGGERIRRNARNYLIPRQREPQDVYNERMARVFYENYAGSIIDWYAATLFRTEPVIELAGSNQSAKAFYAELLEDCDLKQTRITDLFRRQFIDLMIYGRSYLLVDFPVKVKQVGTRAEEDREGFSRAYMVDYRADQVINWERDEQGRYEWVVLRTEEQRRNAAGQFELEERWAYYDKTSFEFYRRTKKQNGSTEIELTGSGQHGLAKLGRVPLIETRVPEGLWLMNKAGLLQLEHFNKSNALSWALTMGLFAMPVVYSDKDWEQMMGESYYIHLGPQDRFGWTEPDGHVFQIAAENLTRLQEEIYRVCYLLTLGGSSASSAAAQSGVSKQRDFALTQEVLRAYGDVVKAAIKRVLRVIEAAREDQLTVEVTGLDQFDIGDFGVELQNAQALLAMGIGSPTLTEQIYKRLALQYLGDFRQELKDRVSREIEAVHAVKK